MNSEKKQIAENIKRWGNAASCAILDPACQIFSVPHIEGMIGYRINSNCAVVFGDPVCPAENKPHLAKAFHEYSKQNGHHIIYLAASEQFTKWARQYLCRTIVEVGEELFMDPNEYPTKGKSGRLLRRKSNHALHAGVTVDEYLEQDDRLEGEINKVKESWVKARKGPQIYLSNLSLFDERVGKRWFYARQNNKVVAVLLINQLDAHEGWLLNLLMVTPEAPNGISELMIVSVLDTLIKENCQFVTFGLTIREQLGEIVGLNRISTWLARWIFKMINGYFQLNARRKFWEKFEPKSEPTFNLFSEPRVGIRELKAIMHVLNAM